MSSPVPIALCGKLPHLTEHFKKAIQPEYEVVQHCDSVESAKTELPAALRGERSGVRRFLAVVVGGGFSPAELAEMRAVQGLEHLVWLYPATANISQQSGPPPAEKIAAGAKKTLTKLGLVDGVSEGDLEPGLHDYMG